MDTSVPLPHSDEYWMTVALEMASQAAGQGEVPVGAVLVKDNELIAKACNQPIQRHDPCAHAEILLLREAGQVLHNYRMPDTRLYVTLEPCSMCAGAMIHARISELYYGASDPKSGAAGSVLQLLQSEQLNHRVAVRGGLLAEQCAEQLREFFQQRRNRMR